MPVPQNLKYAKTHEWVRVEGNIATVGITDHAQSELGDVVYVDIGNEKGKLVFMKYAGGSLVNGIPQPTSETKSKRNARSTRATLPFSLAKSARKGQNTPAA